MKRDTSARCECRLATVVEVLESTHLSIVILFSVDAVWSNRWIGGEVLVVPERLRGRDEFAVGITIVRSEGRCSSRVVASSGNRWVVSQPSVEVVSFSGPLGKLISSVLVHGGGEVVDLSVEEITCGDTLATIVCNRGRVRCDEEVDCVTSSLVESVPAFLKIAAGEVRSD